MEAINSSFNKEVAIITSLLKGQATQTQHRIIEKHSQKIMAWAISDFHTGQIDFQCLMKSPPIFLAELIKNLAIAGQEKFLMTALKHPQGEKIWFLVLEELIKIENWVHFSNPTITRFLEIGINDLGFSKNKALKRISSAITEAKFNLLPEIHESLGGLAELMFQKRLIASKISQ